MQSIEHLSTDDSERAILYRFRNASGSASQMLGAFLSAPEPSECAPVRVMRTIEKALAVSQHGRGLFCAHKKAPAFSGRGFSTAAIFLLFTSQPSRWLRKLPTAIGSPIGSTIVRPVVAGSGPHAAVITADNGSLLNEARIRNAKRRRRGERHCLGSVAKHSA